MWGRGGGTWTGEGERGGRGEEEAERRVWEIGLLTLRVVTVLQDGRSAYRGLFDDAGVWVRKGAEGGLLLTVMGRYDCAMDWVS